MVAHERRRISAAGATLAAATALALATPLGAEAQEVPPETRQFARLAGEWTMTVWARDSTGAWGAEPTSATWSWRVILGGHAVQDIWTAPGPDGPVYGTNVRIYDPASGSWHVRWTASDDRTFMELTGRQEGDSLHLFATHESGRPLRITFHDVESDRFRWTMDVQGGTAGEWVRWSRMEGRRVQRQDGGPEAVPRLAGPGPEGQPDCPKPPFAGVVDDLPVPRTIAYASPPYRDPPRARHGPR